MTYYTVTIHITSDSGVGPYEEDKEIINCKKQTAYCKHCKQPHDIYTTKGVNVTDAFYNTMADFQAVVTKVKRQRPFYRQGKRMTNRI